MDTQRSTITIDIQPEWVAIAQQFAAEQLPAVQGEIFQNTLAILALETYLSWGDIETRLAESYSWHPYTRVLVGWADLLLPQYGRVICCALKPEAESVLLPDILPLNCIGGVTFYLLQETSQVVFTGFISARFWEPDLGEFSTAKLGAIADIFDEFYFLSEECQFIAETITEFNQAEDEFAEYFSPWLHPESLPDIVNRLNTIFYHQDFETLDLFQTEDSEFDVEFDLFIEQEDISFSSLIVAEDAPVFGASLNKMPPSLLAKDWDDDDAYLLTEDTNTEEGEEGKEGEKEPDDPLEQAKQQLQERLLQKLRLFHREFETGL